MDQRTNEKPIWRTKNKYLTYKKFLEKNPGLLKSHEIIDAIGKIVDGFIKYLDEIERWISIWIWMELIWIPL